MPNTCIYPRIVWQGVCNKMTYKHWQLFCLKMRFRGCDPWGIRQQFLGVMTATFLPKSYVIYATVSASCFWREHTIHTFTVAGNTPPAFLYRKMWDFESLSAQRGWVNLCGVVVTQVSVHHVLITSCCPLICTFLLAANWFLIWRLVRGGANDHREQYLRF